MLIHLMAAALALFHHPEPTNTVHRPPPTLCIRPRLQNPSTRSERASPMPKPSPHLPPPQTSPFLTFTASHSENQHLSIPFPACTPLLLIVSISNAVRFSNNPYLRFPPNTVQPKAQSRSLVLVFHRSHRSTKLSTRAPPSPLLNVQSSSAAHANWKLSLVRLYQNHKFHSMSLTRSTL